MSATASKEFWVTAFGLGFTVYGISQPAGSKRGFVAKGTNRVVIVDDNARSKDWKRQVAEVAGALMEGRELFEGPLELHLRFFLPRPSGHFGKRGLKPSAPRFHTVKPDALKLARGVEDSLTGVVYRDDSRIVRETIEKHYCEGSARVEVRLAVKT